MTLDEMREGLYDLDRSELRRLAAEALLISDGVDSPAEYQAQFPGNTVLVTRYETGNLAAFGVDIVE